MTTRAAVEVTGPVVVVCRCIKVAGTWDSATIEIADGINQSLGIVIVRGLIGAPNAGEIVALSGDGRFGIEVACRRVGATDASDKFTRAVVGCGFGLEVASPQTCASENQTTHKVAFSLFLKVASGRVFTKAIKYNIEARGEITTSWQIKICRRVVVAGERKVASTQGSKVTGAIVLRCLWVVVARFVIGTAKHLVFVTNTV